MLSTGNRYMSGKSQKKLWKLLASPTGIEAVDIVSDREDRVVDQHERSGVAHNMAHPLPHGWLVAMYGTPGTDRFLRTKGAFVNTFYCIGKEFHATGAKFKGPVMTPTVNFNHKVNGPAFAVQTFPSLSVVNWFINHRPYRLSYPFLRAPQKVRRDGEVLFL
jgi:hypothetical protein